MADFNFPHQLKQGEHSRLSELLSPVLQGSATRTSDTQINPSALGVVIIVKLANEDGTAGFTPQLLIYDEDGNAIVYWAGSALTANGTYTYVLYPGAMAGAGAGVTANASIILPREWAFRLSYTTGTPGTDTFDTEAHVMYL